MAKSDALFKLIRSLTREEKKHFIFFSNKHVINHQNNYMELFYTIDNISEKEVYINEKYYESALLAQIKSHSVKTKLSFYKNYLFDLILKSLRVYDSNEKTLIDIQKSLLDINLLIRKNLLDQAIKKIKSTKKLAKGFQYDLEHYQLCLIERKLFRRTINNITRDSIQIQKLKLETENSLHEINVDSNILALYEEAFLLTKTHTRTPSEKLESYVERNLFEIITPNPTFHQTAIYLLTCSNYYFPKRNFNKCLGYLKKLLDLFDQNEKMIPEDIDRYINTLNNYLSYCIITNKFDEFEIYFKKFDSIKTKSIYLNNLIDQHRYYLSSIYYLQTKSFQKAIENFFPQLIIWLDNFEGKIPTSRLLTIYYSISITYFMVGEYQLAKDWNNKLINMEVKKVRRVVLAAARFLDVIISHELGHYLAIEYMVKNLKKYLKQVDRYGSAEHKILKALFNSSIAPDDKIRKTIFHHLAIEIDQLEMKNKEIDTIKEWFKRKGH